MEKTYSDNLLVNSFKTPFSTEYFIHSHGVCEADVSEMFDAVFPLFTAYQAKPVFFRIFASETLNEQIACQYSDKFSRLACPISWMTQDKPGNVSFFAIQIKAVSGLSVKPLFFEDTHVGCRYEDEYFRYYKLNLASEISAGSDFDQAVQLFDRYQSILSSLNMDFSNTIRTWLFARDILDWYTDLNVARNDFFTKHDIFNQLVPASTGIGLANYHGSAMQTELLAVVPKSDAATIQAVTSPLQCPALDYKSSFSRAVKIQTPDYSSMTVSGTASIEPGGKTIHIDDTPKQVDLTMRVVDALLKNGGMDWADTTNAIVYFKDRSDFPLFDEYCQANGLQIPHIKVNADICRDDLLFEIELDTLK